MAQGMMRNEARRLMVLDLEERQKEHEKGVEQCREGIRALQATCDHRWGGRHSGSHATYHECEICGKSEEC